MMHDDGTHVCPRHDVPLEESWSWDKPYCPVLGCNYKED